MRLELWEKFKMTKQGNSRNTMMKRIIWTKSKAWLKMLGCGRKELSTMKKPYEKLRKSRRLLKTKFTASKKNTKLRKPLSIRKKASSFLPIRFNKPKKDWWRCKGISALWICFWRKTRKFINKSWHPKRRKSLIWKRRLFDTKKILSPKTKS